MERAAGKLRVTVALLALVAGVLIPAAQSAQALTGDSFDPGYIISDATFSHATSMSESQIQGFLVGMEPTCPGANGATCLRYYSDASFSRAASPSGQCGAYTGAASEMASTIIFKVAQACQVNPQVLLATLQKEQGLITATSPSPAAYRSAMGYGCPDTAPCDAQYYGFYNQVYKAAWQMREYIVHPSSWRYHVGSVAILYKPNAPTCAAPFVNIRSAATAALYNYTPYQPNSAALANLSGTGDECSSYGNRNFWVYFNNWFGSSIGQVSPLGVIDTLDSPPGSIHVGGWAFDPDSKDPIQVAVYINGVGTTITANIARPDVDAAYGGVGPLHGYDVTLPVATPGPQQVCVYAINVGPGTNTLVNCIAITARAGSPIGMVDAIVASAGTITVSGWTLDQDTASPTPVHIYVDSSGVAYIADQPRPDVAAAFPGYGPNHGFSFTVPASPGAHTVCAYGINSVGTGSNVALACQSVFLASGSPVGVLDGVSVAPGTISASGWVFDPDTAASIPVHIYSDLNGIAFTADKSRPDVGAIYAVTANHGYSETFAATPGVHNVCAYGINTVAPGANIRLGCRFITAMSGSPIGSADVITGSAGQITTGGWVFDPDTSAPAQIRMEVDGAPTLFASDQSRTDIGAAYPAYGSAHGFNATIPGPAGSHRVCVYGVNTGPGFDSLLGCKTLTL